MPQVLILRKIIPPTSVNFSGIKCVYVFVLVCLKESETKSEEDVLGGGYRLWQEAINKPVAQLTTARSLQLKG